VAYSGGTEPGRWEIVVPTGELGAPVEWAEDFILIVGYAVHLEVA
jgi:hypothetical protein